MNNENYSGQPEPVPEWAKRLFDRIYMLHNISSRIEKIECNLQNNHFTPMLQGEPFNFDHEIQPDIQQIMEFRPPETTVEEDYTNKYVFERLSVREPTASAELLQPRPEIKKKNFRSAFDREKRSFMAQSIQVHRSNYRENRDNNKHNNYNKCKQSNKLNFLKLIIIILSILLESEEKSRDASSRKAKPDLRGIEQDNHQHLGSESINQGIQNNILLASSNQAQTKVENPTIKQVQKKCDRNRSFKPPHKESYRGGIGPESNILFQSVFSTKENRGLTTNPESPSTQPICDEELVKDGIFKLSMHDDQKRGFHVVDSY
ncbi:hypothetical protein BB560_003297 [Smittium megazygosporum]|uniref:Uncharacterized protein n=1 Tax=Smittium megazygosporum TaxID=133381 RepID=A0A2T9ZCC5_9FUNG|nr:hypothetical protein BB560_003297 [Smittium megazygosporum]